jgi:hypothetical protein
MTSNELKLKRVLLDAIELMRWQSREPLTAAAWAHWIMRAIDALDDVQRDTSDTVVFTKPFTKAQLRKAARHDSLSVKTV